MPLNLTRKCGQHIKIYSPNGNDVITITVKTLTSDRTTLTISAPGLIIKRDEQPFDKNDVHKHIET